MVSGRTQFHVAPHDNQWRVIRDGQVIFESQIKTEAVEQAEAAARMAHPSRLLIHKTDGTIDSERRYEDDPYSTVRKRRRHRHA